jgi:hypothetical protein
MAAPSVPVKKVAFNPMRSFAHILANVAFADESALATLFAAWNTLFDCVRPNLVILDHSPGALLALHERPIPKVNIGLGFFCPPPHFPLPFWLTGREESQAKQVVADEKDLTDRVNRVLQLFHRAPLRYLGEMYRHIDETILATYEEFDHFGPRTQARYWGHWPFAPGAAPIWPQVSGPRVFAYLKRFAGLESLINGLIQMGCPTIVFGADSQLQERFIAPTIRHAGKPLDLRAIGQQCDIAILNAGHGTTVTMLLAGKPCLLFPLFTEQVLFAQKVQKLGAGQYLEPRAGDFRNLMERFVQDGNYARQARLFSTKYAGFEPGSQVVEIADQMERLMK